MDITRIPPGYAYGYVPLNGCMEIDDLSSDTRAICEPFDVLAVNRKQGSDAAWRKERQLQRQSFVMGAE